VSTVSVQVSATSELQPPKGGSDPMDGLRTQAGLFGIADSIVHMLTGFSPLQEWVFKPVAGDWTALSKGADAWRNTAKASQQLARVIDSFPSQVGQDWQGATADAWQKANAQAVQLFQQYPDQCQKLATTYDAIAQAAQAIAGLIADILSQLGSIIAQAGIEAAIPVAGWAAEVKTAKDLAELIIKGGTRISQELTAFARLIERLIPMVEEVATLAQHLGTLANGLRRVAPVVMEVAEFGAKHADTLFEVGSAVKKGSDILDKVETYGKDAIKIADTSREAAHDAALSR
jgi:uncharacterized protein YukE